MDVALYDTAIEGITETLSNAAAYLSDREPPVETEISDDVPEWTGNYNVEDIYDNARVKRPPPFRPTLQNIQSGEALEISQLPELPWTDGYSESASSRPSTPESLPGRTGIDGIRPHSVTGIHPSRGSFGYQATNRLQSAKWRLNSFKAQFTHLTGRGAAPLSFGTRVRDFLKLSSGKGAAIIFALSCIVAVLSGVINMAIEKAEDKKHSKTRVSITIAECDGYDEEGEYIKCENNVEGSVPHLEIWDEAGHSVGQYRGDKNGHIDQGDSAEFEIIHNDRYTSEPEYLTVAMADRHKKDEGDAICIAQIQMVTPNGMAYNWLGDVGFMCGQSWYVTTKKANEYGYKPRCVWLDSDSTDNTLHQAMGLHMPDFLFFDARAVQYFTYPETLCESPPRFAFYHRFEPEKDAIPVFSPPLEYAMDYSDKDFSKVVHVYGMVRKSKYRTPKERVPMKGTNIVFEDAMLGGPYYDYNSSGTIPTDKQKRAMFAGQGYPRGAEKQLVSSDHHDHDIDELCDPRLNSYGPDFISMTDKMFCDMAQKQLWPLCSDAEGIVHACFDYKTKVMRPSQAGIGKRDVVTGRDVPTKQYHHERVWRRSGKEHVRVLKRDGQSLVDSLDVTMPEGWNSSATFEVQNTTFHTPKPRTATFDTALGTVATLSTMAVPAALASGI